MIVLLRNCPENQLAGFGAGAAVIICGHGQPCSFVLVLPTINIRLKRTPSVAVYKQVGSKQAVAGYQTFNVQVNAAIVGNTYCGAGAFAGG